MDWSLTTQPPYSPSISHSSCHRLNKRETSPQWEILSPEDVCAQLMDESPSTSIVDPRSSQLYHSVVSWSAKIDTAAQPETSKQVVGEISASAISRHSSFDSSLSSWYDRSVVPLSISQQTSSSAMAKGLPTKAMTLLDLNNSPNRLAGPSTSSSVSPLPSHAALSAQFLHNGPASVLMHPPSTPSSPSPEDSTTPKKKSSRLDLGFLLRSKRKPSITPPNITSPLSAAHVGKLSKPSRNSSQSASILTSHVAARAEKHESTASRLKNKWIHRSSTTPLSNSTPTSSGSPISPLPKGTPQNDHLHNLYRHYEQMTVGTDADDEVDEREVAKSSVNASMPIEVASDVFELDPSSYVTSVPDHDLLVPMSPSSTDPSTRNGYPDIRGTPRLDHLSTDNLGNQLPMALTNHNNIPTTVPSKHPFEDRRPPLPDNLQDKSMLTFSSDDDSGNDALWQSCSPQNFYDRASYADDSSSIPCHSSGSSSKRATMASNMTSVTVPSETMSLPLSPPPQDKLPPVPPLPALPTSFAQPSALPVINTSRLSQFSFSNTSNNNSSNFEESPVIVSPESRKTNLKMNPSPTFSHRSLGFRHSTTGDYRQSTDESVSVRSTPGTVHRNSSDLADEESPRIDSDSERPNRLIAVTKQEELLLEALRNRRETMREMILAEVRAEKSSTYSTKTNNTNISDHSTLNSSMSFRNVRPTLEKLDAKSSDTSTSSIHSEPTVSGESYRSVTVPKQPKRISVCEDDVPIQYLSHPDYRKHQESCDSIDTNIAQPQTRTFRKQGTPEFQQFWQQNTTTSAAPYHNTNTLSFLDDLGDTVAAEHDSIPFEFGNLDSIQEISEYDEPFPSSARATRTGQDRNKRIIIKKQPSPYSKHQLVNPPSPLTHKFQTSFQTPIDNHAEYGMETDSDYDDDDHDDHNVSRDRSHDRSHLHSTDVPRPDSPITSISNFPMPPVTSRPRGHVRLSAVGPGAF